MQELIFHIAYMERVKYQDEQTQLIGGMNECIMYDAIVIQNRVIEGLRKEYAEYLEKEKEQIIDAMAKTAMYVGVAPFDEEIANMTFEDLYNQTYSKDEFDFQMPEKEIEARNIIQDLKDRYEKD